MTKIARVSCMDRCVFKYLIGESFNSGKFMDFNARLLKYLQILACFKSRCEEPEH